MASSLRSTVAVGLALRAVLVVGDETDREDRNAGAEVDDRQCPVGAGEAQHERRGDQEGGGEIVAGGVDLERQAGLTSVRT